MLVSAALDKENYFALRWVWQWDSSAALKQRRVIPLFTEGVWVAQFQPWIGQVGEPARRDPGPNEDELEHTQIRLPITLECARKIGDIIKTSARPRSRRSATASTCSYFAGLCASDPRRDAPLRW